MTNSVPSLDCLVDEQQRLKLDAFDYEIAWAIGAHIRAEGMRHGLPIAIEVAHGADPVFISVLPGASPDNIDWTRRKRAVALRFHKSSLYMRLQAEANGYHFNERFRLPAADYVASGGSVPLTLRNGLVVGTVAVSGLPDFQDHALAVDAIVALSARMI